MISFTEAKPTYKYLKQEFEELKKIVLATQGYTARLVNEAQEVGASVPARARPETRVEQALQGFVTTRLNQRRSEAQIRQEVNTLLNAVITAHQDEQQQVQANWTSVQQGH